jgi:hypothetical protein
MLQKKFTESIIINNINAKQNKKNIIKLDVVFTSAVRFTQSLAVAVVFCVSMVVLSFLFVIAFFQFLIKLLLSSNFCNQKLKRNHITHYTIYFVAYTFSHSISMLYNSL